MLGLRIPPKSADWIAYANALDELASHMARSLDWKRMVRINVAQVPAKDAPYFHAGVTSGIGIKQGAEFLVTLSNGRTYRA